MRKKRGLKKKVGWIEGAWSMALLVLLFSPGVMGMVVVIALAPAINRNSDKILPEGEAYLHWTFRLLSEYIGASHQSRQKCAMTNEESA